MLLTRTHDLESLMLDGACRQHGAWPPTSNGVRWPGRLFTSADALLLSGQDPGSVNDADAVQDRVGQLGAHEPTGEQSQVEPSGGAVAPVSTPASF
jgi:hypothetical protein